MTHSFLIKLQIEGLLMDKESITDYVWGKAVSYLSPTLHQSHNLIQTIYSCLTTN